MRALIFIPLAVALVCAGGYATCALTGWNVHPREMIVAAVTCLAAGVLALTPLLIVRWTSVMTPANAAQSALIATMIHLFICIGVAAVVLLMKIPLAPAFTYWLAALYWATLAALSAGLIAEVRAASRTPAQKQ